MTNTMIAQAAALTFAPVAAPAYCPHDGSIEDEHGNAYPLSYAEFAHRAEVPYWIEACDADGRYSIGTVADGAGTTHHTHEGVAVTIARVEVWWWCPGIGLVLYVGTDDRVYYWSSFRD